MGTNCGSDLVVVTGGSGFVAVHCILALLQAGYRVRTTVRSMKRADDVRAMLAVAGIQPNESLAFAVADLTSDAGWREVMAGSTFALHVASPLPAKPPKDENDLIVPARDGTIRVLRAARDSGLRRLVLTSSFAAIGYGHPPSHSPLSERDWTNLETPGLGAYVKSKTVAERAAWDFIAREGSSLELSVVNPTVVFGPLLGADYSASIQLVQRLMDGSLPGVPHISFGIVDVRDVADLHLRAMTNPEANGERFIAVSGDFMTFQQLSQMLKARLGEAARRVPTRALPNWLVHMGALVDRSLKSILPELGKPKAATSDKARRLLGWSPRPNSDAVVATAESLIQLGLLPQSSRAVNESK